MNLFFTFRAVFNLALIVNLDEYYSFLSDILEVIKFELLYQCEFKLIQCHSFGENSKEKKMGLKLDNDIEKL
jgi:hypothetical protein